MKARSTMVIMMVIMIISLTIMDIPTTIIILTIITIIMAEGTMAMETITTITADIMEEEDIMVVEVMEEAEDTMGAVDIIINFVYIARICHFLKLKKYSKI